MPLYKIISVSGSTRVYIWKVEESEDILAEDTVLTENSKERVSSMRSEIHRRGYLSIRHLLAEAGYTDNDLFYDEVGKPHLKDDSYISITHSGIFTGIIVSKEKEVGIDIEKQREKIIAIAHKFTPLKEYQSITKTQALIRKLTIVWGAKESLYKIYATKGLSFLNHIYIHDFTLEDRETTGKIKFYADRSSYDIEFLEFDGYTCVFALKRSNE